MATYQQYSEVVAAYGHTLPPPEQPEVNRIGIALLYAAIGVALGTMTGTGMAVVSQQPGGVTGWAHRLTLPNFSAPKSVNPSAPVVAHTTTAPAPSATPTVQANAIAPAAPAPVQAQTAAPVVSATVQAKITAPAPAPAVAKAAPAPVAHTSLLASVIAPSTVEASVDTKALQTTSSSRTGAVNPRLASAPVVHQQDAPVNAATATRKPAVNVATMHTPAALPIPSVVPVSLDEQLAPAVFYSEGDATVVDYDSSLNTILTSDGRTFVIGSTVAMSTATPWGDYRSNVHYRCDQGGKCTLTRSGVIALNAKQI